MQLGLRQQQVIELLSQHDGGLAVLHLRQAIPGIKPQLLLRAVERLGRLGIVTITHRSRHDRDGDLVALHVAVKNVCQAALPIAGTIWAPQARSGTP